jgi:hypothetical protein
MRWEAAAAAGTGTRRLDDLYAKLDRLLEEVSKLIGTETDDAEAKPADAVIARSFLMLIILAGCVTVERGHTLTIGGY